MAGVDEKTMFGDTSSFALQMKRLINNKDMSDIKFLIGPNRKPVYAHRCLLSARCDVFRAMFLDQAKNKESQDVPFVMSDISMEIFMPILEFIYTNAVTLSSKNAVDVLGSALEYGMDDLRKLSVRYLIENLSINTASEAMQAAVTYGQDELREKALNYTENNTSGVFKTKGFHEMSEDALSVVLDSDQLQLDELDILNAVREWATVNSVVLSKPVNEVAKKVIWNVRLALLSPDELAKVEKENEKDHMVPVELMSMAWRFHALRKPDKKNAFTKRRKGTTLRDSHKGLENL
ncbi:BTB/POZ domain-containing protein 19-like [Tubulanus polymorphus]|uniref:BTB/POZ domain-containing protein 19-like n=1 Tax=Tubulanus polymorphus TaxID=672921 RepID=UPI003DA380C1